MCTIIKNIKSDIKIEDDINDNPPLNIISINLTPPKKINIIQDNILIAGTKQRVSTLFIQKIIGDNNSIKTLVYAGSYNGFGAIATAYSAYKLNLKCIVFLSSIATGSNKEESYDKIVKSKQIRTLIALNAKIYLCKSYREARELEYKISQYPDWTMTPGYFIVPMGLNDSDGIMINLLSIQIKKAIKNNNNFKSKNIRIWLVAGSGGILMSLVKALPNATFFVLLTGGGKYIDMVKQYIAQNKNNKKNNISIINGLDISGVINNSDKYYESVKGYDNQIFPYVKKYAKDGDYIWNVGSD